MSEVSNALRNIAYVATSEHISLGALDDLDDDVAGIAAAVSILERHHAISSQSGTSLAIQSAQDALNAARDRVAAANAPKVADADLMPVRGARQGAELLLEAISASLPFNPRGGQLVLDIDGMTTSIKPTDVSVRETDGRWFFMVGVRAWALADAIAVTDPNCTSEWPALMTRSGSVVRVRPA